MISRRQAIQQISIMGLGMVLYPSCKMEEVPNYTRVPLDRKQYKLLRQVSEAILPVDHLVYVTPEPRSEFILTILNDCTSTEEIQRYLGGLETLRIHLKKEGKSKLEDLSNEALDQVFAFMESSKTSNENLYDFYHTTRNLARQHFTGCEKFMTEELKYEFVPGRYIGCKVI